MISLSLLAVLALAPAAPCAAPPCAVFQERTADVETMIERGRALLEAGRPDDAESVFLEAARLDGDSLRTRMWVLRAWMDQGKSNDTLDALDALRKGGASGSEMDYLYGMAFARRAEGYIAQGAAGNASAMNMIDAQAFLARALEADPERYRDAFLPLAKAAWYNQDLPASRSAAEEAVRRAPESAAAWDQLGRTAFSQYVPARGAADQAAAAEDADATTAEAGRLADEAEALWKRARDAFEREIELLGKPDEPGQRRALANAAVQLGNLYGWKGEHDAAAAAFETAASWAPSAVDFGQVLGIVGAERLRDALKAAREAFRARARKPDVRDEATLSWWLGFCAWSSADYALAEEAFTAAVTKWPEFTNSWYYLYRTRYASQRYDEAIAALRKNWELHPEGIVAMVSGDPNNFPILEYLADRRARAGELEPATLVFRVLAESAPHEAIYWNNLALFLRDRGDALVDPRSRGARERASAEDLAEATRLWEESFAAYERALDVEPDNANYLNDAAVLLHYNLRREQDRAREMYQRALAIAEEGLAASPEPAQRELLEKARREASDNLALLERERGGGGR